MPKRLTGVGLIASFGPADRPETMKGMDLGNRIAFALARRLPWPVLLWMTGMMERTFKKDPEGTARRRFASMPAGDRRALGDRDTTDMLLASMVESFRPGADGSAWELRLLTRPWGFDPGNITVPVSLWHGDSDTNVPVGVAHHLSHTIPDASLTVLPGEGHFFIMKRWGAIIRQLTAAAPT